jgi:O-antigen ligase
MIAAIQALLNAGTQLRPYKRHVRSTFWIVSVALFTVATFAISYELPSDQSITILSVGLTFSVLIWSVISFGNARLRNRNLLFSLWWILLGSEAVFSYVTEDTTGGQISRDAYSEAMIWVFIILAFLLYTYRSSEYLGKLFTGAYKWVSWFGVICFLSCAYAEQPWFSLAWIVKLFLAILLLAACNYEIKDDDDLRAFLKATQYGLVFLVIVPIVRLLGNPEVLATGRLYDVATAPTVLSVDAGLLVLYSLTLAQPGKGAIRNFLVCLGMVMMLLAGGKTGILGCIFAALAFFILQGRFKPAASFLGTLTVVGGLLVAFTPLGTYLKSYLKSGDAATVTGRSEVWATGWELIKAKMLLGRGFMSSRFVANKIDVSWQPLHLHNGFLEVMYNNGLIGLFITVMMQGCIVRNLLQAIRVLDRDHPFRRLAIGCFAIYIDILVNGLVSRTFGSRPDGTFMILFSLVFVSDRLLATAKKNAECVEIPAWQPSPFPGR